MASLPRIIERRVSFFFFFAISSLVVRYRLLHRPSRTSFEIFDDIKCRARSIATIIFANREMRIETCGPPFLFRGWLNSDREKLRPSCLEANRPRITPSFERSRWADETSLVAISGQRWRNRCAAAD